MISSEQLAKVLSDKLKLKENDSNSLARLLVEGSQESAPEDSKQVEKKTHCCDKADLIERVKSSIQDYMLFKPFAMTQIFTRLQGMLEDKLAEFKDDMELEADQEETEFLSMEAIWRLWKELMLPNLESDVELFDFVEMFALKCSDSLQEVNYKQFVEIFSEDY